MKINEDNKEREPLTEKQRPSKFAFDETEYIPWEATRKKILLISALSPVLNPLTGSFFIPTLPTIIEDFNATHLETALVYSLYLLVVAVSKLLWGPFIDKYSRKWCLIIALLQFIFIYYITAFAFDMWYLIITRSLAGIPMSSYFVISSSIISDIFPPNKRGFAMAVRQFPILINVLLGPPIGG